MKDGQRWRSKGSETVSISITSEALKAPTLGVPAGWNKPASRIGEYLCQEVEKTCRWRASGVKTRMSCPVGDGAERDETQGGSGVPAGVDR